MPPWHTRLHLGSPSSKSSTNTKLQSPRSPLQDVQSNGHELPDTPLHGVPILSTDKFSPQSRPKSQHSRSHSHPFPSLFGSSRALNGDDDDDVDGDDGLLDSLTGQKEVKPGFGDEDMVSSFSKGNKDLTTGRCATCDSLVRWPRQLDVFRCTVCLMVNDLKSTSILLEDSRHTEVQDVGRSSVEPLKASMMGKDTLGRSSSLYESQPRYSVPHISLERTRRLIDECLDDVLESGPLQSSSKTSPPGGGDMRQGSALPTRTRQASVKGVDIVQSTSKPKDDHSTTIPPSKTLASSQNTIIDRNNALSKSSAQQSIEPTSSLFRPLESYIIACFTGVGCLNSSFLTSKPPTGERAASESTIVNQRAATRSGDLIGEAIPFPELDAKTLLLGDFAENGMWWAGRSPPLEATRPQTAKDRSETSNDIVNAKSPRINWSEVKQWYDTIATLRSFSRARLHEKNSRITVLAEASLPASQLKYFQYLDKSITESCAHVHRTLFKATENLLRRPGRLLKTPNDCRFLLILLANPLLSISERVQPTQPPTMHISTSAPGYQEQSVTLKPPPLAIRPSSIGSKHSPGGNATTPRHTGIIKRILGVISNLPPQCHHHLVNWFSRFSEIHLRGLVDLIGSFVSYRLSRQNMRKRSNSHDATAGGLIPSVSGPGAGTSAQLHAAIGISTNVRYQDNPSSGSLYSHDWQIKAAAKVMALLFSANNNDPISRHEKVVLSSQDSGRARAGSAATKRAHRHGQLLPTCVFYNTMLDYFDLIHDFETWESRRGKFSFCEYPMFLSIWAKIHIMEHDARRQMEIKAREAFFNSIMSRKAINQYLVLKVRRDCLVEDSLRGVSEVVGTGQEEIKKGLRIEFLGEEGLDSGGLRKEWFLLLVREVFDPEHGLFVYDEDSHYCYFNPNTFETSDQFFLVGVLLGLAIYNSTILDVALPPFAFRKLLASAPSYTGPTTSSSRPSHGYSLDDLAEYRPAFAHGLRQLLEFDGDVEQTFLLDFVAVTERYGQLQNISLCPNGENRPVTNSSRREYVDLYTRYLLDTAVSRQYEPFKRGFYTVCGGNALSLFRPEEIELLVRGSDEALDISTLRAVAIYDGWGKGVNPANEPSVSWFWDAFSTANPRDQRKLLSFITASDRIPAMGATSLVIKVACLGDDIDRYPIARTCFNIVGLYRYRSRDMLESKLWRAVAEGEGFGFK